MIRVVVVALALAAIVSCEQTEPTASPTPTATTAGYNPVIDPGNFVTEIDNPYLAFGPGATAVSEGETDGEFERVTVRVTAETKTIMGVRCVVVEDIVTTKDGEIVEKTFDWYAQDREGNVWYFGEDSIEYEDGKPATSAGSWEAGKDGAKPGILMKANPGAGDLYRQEYYVGEAEDLAEVLSVDEQITVGGKSYDDVLVTREWTNLEPGVMELKYYAKGVGIIREKAVAGGKGQIDLVVVTKVD